VSAAADAGLITLEWLLIVGAIAGLAASSVLVVQRVIDDTADVPADPVVRLLEADIEAAFVASEAQAAFGQALNSGPAYVDGDFADRCQVNITQDFGDVVASAAWIPPADNGTPDIGDDVPARCVVTPASGLGG
jgi:hypothetical protein